jgi:hypothetical protein
MLNLSRLSEAELERKLYEGKFWPLRNNMLRMGHPPERANAAADHAARRWVAKRKEALRAWQANA